MTRLDFTDNINPIIKGSRTTRAQHSLHQTIDLPQKNNYSTDEVEEKISLHLVSLKRKIKITSLYSV